MLKVQIVDFLTSELGSAPSRIAKLDAFPGNAVYDVDTDDQRLIVKASTNHGALRAEAWACTRAAAAGCAAPAILRFGRLNTAMSAIIMSRVKGEPITADHPAFSEVGANLRRLHGVTMTGFGWLAEAPHPSWPNFLQSICDDTRELTTAVADAAESAITTHAATLAAIDTGVLCHGGLKAAHILIDDGRLAGLIDWGDALAADPWFDIARFAHRSPAASRALLLQNYRPKGEPEWRLPLYEALWMLVDACVAHRHGHNVDATLQKAMGYLTAAQAF
jgi:aminoglycoside phosphotransferase (APT) family kinase protein